MKYDVIMVLGRGISEKGELPRVSIKSVQVTKELLAKNLAPRVLFCGRWSRHFDFVPVTTEANAMRTFAIEIGIPKEKIFIEDQSLDTISNFYYAKKNIFIPNNWKNILLVTLHKKDERALLMAHYILGPEYTIEGFSIDFEFPKEKAEHILNIEKEKVRIFKDFLKSNHIKPGDDEKLFQEHLRYIREHNIPPTFKEN